MICGACCTPCAAPIHRVPRRAHLILSSSAARRVRMLRRQLGDKGTLSETERLWFSCGFRAQGPGSRV
eukprot:2142447-Rhodomonas_salina.2